MRAVRTLTVSCGIFTVEEVTLILVRMTPAQVATWKWVGDMWNGTDPVQGYEVRDTTGALLGVLLPLGHTARHIHAEWFDPATEEFYAAGETDAVLTQGMHRVLDAYGRYVRPVPSGADFQFDEPRYLPTRLACLTGLCADTCPDCEADHEGRDADRLAWSATF